MCVGGGEGAADTFLDKGRVSSLACLVVSLSRCLVAGYDGSMTLLTCVRHDFKIFLSRF